MDTTITWIDDLTFMGETSSGHSLTITAGEKFGGRDSAVRPMELVLLGLGGCTAIDVMSMLKKSRQDVHDCRVVIQTRRAEKTPKVFTHIHVHFIITGHDIKEASVARAISLSQDKYCSVTIMLSKSVEITHDYEIIEASER